MLVNMIQNALDMHLVTPKPYRCFLQVPMATKPLKKSFEQKPTNIVSLYFYQAKFSKITMI
jgi:hypothetical protein